MTLVNKIHSNNQLRLILGLCLSIAFTSQTSWGRSNDRDQVLDYTADGNTTIANENGMRIVTVRENVFIKQGSMELRGNVAVLEYDQNSELKKVSVTGEPARFQQEPDSGEGLILGSSDTIIYLPAETENMLDMVGNASFSQNGSQMNCARIQHSIDGGSTEMTGPCSGTLPPQAN